MNTRLCCGRLSALVILAAGLYVASVACTVEEKTAAGATTFELPADPANYNPLDGYMAMVIPENNPMTSAKAELGWKLYFDERLSGDGQRSCYGCHQNDKGMSDGRQTALGAFDKVLARNSPSLWNIGYHSMFYWDGRANSLEGQAVAAWTGGNMGATKPDKVAEVIAAINAIPEYMEEFQTVFGENATIDNIPQALACYMRTFISQTTPYDDFKNGNESAISAAAARGAEVFKKAACDKCHSGILLTDMVFHNVGIGMDKEDFDVGRFKVSADEKDKGAFKTPSLKDVAESGPYFHDGSVATLEEAVTIMVGGGIDNPYLDTENIKKAEITDAEKADLIEFLKSLTETLDLEIPTLPGI